MQFLRSRIPPAPDCCQFEAVVRFHLPHGNVLRYTLEASGVLFRSIQLFENGSRLYLSGKKAFSAGGARSFGKVVKQQNVTAAVWVKIAISFYYSATFTNEKGREILYTIQ